MQLILDIEYPKSLEDQLKNWAKNLSKYLTYNQIGRYLLDKTHAELWIPELNEFLFDKGFKIDHVYLEVNKRASNSDWQKFLPENSFNYALHVPVEGYQNWVVEYVANTTMPSFDKLGLAFSSSRDSTIEKHYGYKSLETMFIMRTDRQWRKTHLERPAEHIAKFLLITLQPVDK
jgi:hypothetical protein